MLPAFSIRSIIAARQTDASTQPLDTIVDGRTSKFIHTGSIL
jgi:hypothetical protein